jgi:hypothetical protein
MIAMVCRPVEFIALVFLVNGVLRPITSNIDKCKGLAQRSVPSGPALPATGYQDSGPEKGTDSNG